MDQLIYFLTYEQSQRKPLSQLCAEADYMLCWICNEHPTAGTQHCFFQAKYFG